MPLLPDAIRRVLERVLGADGYADQSLRTAVADTAAAAAGVVRTPGVVPAELELFVNKVIHSPYKVVDRDIDQLRSAGFSEDQIFELTVATALGAAAGRMEKMLALLDDEQSTEDQLP